jgi:hypothetical protein
MSVEYKYVLFPLPLVQEIFKKPQNGFIRLFYYGIYRSAITQDVSTESAIKQALYCFYRGGLTQSLQNKISDLTDKGIIYLDEDYNGFSGNEFDPEDGISEIIQHNDTELINEIVEFHKLRQIKEVLNLTFDIQVAIKHYNDLNFEYANFEKAPLVSISTKMLLDFISKDKSEFEKVLFTCYCGIRSIIGKKKYCQTTRDMIFCRMVGVKSPKDIESLTDKKLKGIYHKYNVRYQREKILDYLVSKHFLSSKIGMNRRTYLSCSLNHDELANAIIRDLEQKSIKSGFKQNKINELQAKNKILQHINK